MTRAKVPRPGGHDMARITRRGFTLSLTAGALAAPALLRQGLVFSLWKLVFC